MAEFYRGVTLTRALEAKQLYKQANKQATSKQEDKQISILTYMSVDQNPPPYCFYKERNLRILHRDCWKVGKGRFQEGFRKVHRKDINTWRRFRIQEGSGRFQEGRAGRALAYFSFIFSSFVFFLPFLVCFFFVVLLFFSFMLCSLLFVVLSFVRFYLLFVSFLG